MKKIWMLLTGALLSVCLWMGIGTPLEARAQDVTLERGEEVYYEKYSTFYYYIDGELGYCLEPEKNSPHGGTFPADFLDNDSLLAKALYYVYGGPGYEDYLSKEIPEKWAGKEGAYCFSHCLLSYIYGGCTGEGEVFLGMSEESRKEIIRCAELIKGYPQIPAPDLQFSCLQPAGVFQPQGEGAADADGDLCRRSGESGDHPSAGGRNSGQ